MICMLIKRVGAGYEVDGQFMGYGNRNIIEAFAMEGIYQENWQPVKRTISRTEDGEMYK